MLADVSKKARKRFVIIISIFAGILLLLLLTIAVVLGNRSIYRGIAIEGCNVSGMDKEKASEAVRQMLDSKYPSNSFIVRYGDKELNYSFDEVSFQFLIEDAVNKVYAIGRTGSLPNRLSDIVMAALYGKTFKIDENFDSDKVHNLIVKIKLSADKKVKNAQISYKSGKISILEDTTGYSMDIDTSRNLLENQLMERNFDNIILTLNEITPEITAEKINDIDSVLSSFSTKFNTSDVDRSYNIKLACSRISGRIVMPGEVFSMNEALGPRTAENGYREAPVILKNELVKGTGGGVCQVTTTLYNAVLESCLKVVERSHHSMPLGYVQPGQDATIAEGSIDFRFRNSMDYPICINAEAVSNTLVIRILGNNSEAGRVVKLVSEIVEEYPSEENEILSDDTLKDGESVVAREPRKGLRVILYRDLYDKAGKWMKREKITEDYYKPVKGQLLVSPGDYKKITGG